MALYPVDANVLPIAGDPTPGNNTIIGGLQATATVADLAARITATSGQIEVGATVGFSAWAQHLSGNMLPQGTLRIEIEGGATVDHVDVRCDEVDVFPFLVALNCPLPQLQTGESSNTFLVTVQATTGEEITGHARLLLPSYVQDTDASNDAEDADVTVGGVQPAGTLVFSSNRVTGNDLAQLFTKNLATGTVNPITVLQNYTDAVWSPNGTRVAAIRGSGLWLMDADGTNAVEYNLASRDDIGIGSPSWSPDGLKIVFHGVFDSEAGQDRELWVFDIATTGVTRLTNNNVSDEFPDWSRLRQGPGR